MFASGLMSFYRYCFFYRGWIFTTDSQLRAIQTLHVCVTSLPISAV